MKKVYLQQGLISGSLLMLSWLLLSCGTEREEQGIPLPFYNSADFTPEWISKSQPEYKNIHEISGFSFQNQEGEIVDNERLAGKIHVVDFFYTSCPSICPKMTSNLSKVMQEFRTDPDVMLLSFSVMPWVDSVSVLKSYADIKGIDANRWHLLTGPQEEIYELARTSYFAEKEIGMSKDVNEFLHTENFILIDEKGRIRGVYNGTLSLEVTRLISDIRTLQKLG